MKNILITLLVSILFVCAVPVFAGEGSEEAAFNKLSLRIKGETLSGRDCEELGYVDETGGKLQVSWQDNPDRKFEVDFKNEYEGRRYQLDIRNQSDVDLSALQFKCRFFYTAESHWREKIEQMDFQCFCTVGARSKYKVETTPFVMHSWKAPAGVNLSDRPNEMECKPEGLWVKVTYTTSDGKTLTRDFYERPSLSKLEWVDTPAVEESSRKRRKK